MGELGRIHQLIIPVFGHSMAFNLEVILMTWIAFILLFILGRATVSKLGIIPNSMQVVGELFVSNLYQLTEDALDPQLAKKYGPLICALFLFLLVSNWLGIIPHLEEPTKDLNTPLSLGVMGFVIAHAAGIRKKGLKNMPVSTFSLFFSWRRLTLLESWRRSFPFLFDFSETSWEDQSSFSLFPT
jgi:F-type H+-transporting ATPase subunit a